MDNRIEQFKAKMQDREDYHKELLGNEKFVRERIAPLASVYGYGDAEYVLALHSKGGFDELIKIIAVDKTTAFYVGVSWDSHRAMVDDFVKAMSDDDRRLYLDRYDLKFIKASDIVLTLKLKDILGWNIDADVVDDVVDDLGIAFVGPLALTEEGKKRFAEALDLEVEATCEDRGDDEDFIEVKLDKYPEGVWQKKRRALKEFLLAAAGYVSEGAWNAWFRFPDVFRFPENNED